MFNLHFVYINNYVIKRPHFCNKANARNPTPGHGVFCKEFFYISQKSKYTIIHVYEVQIKYLV